MPANDEPCTPDLIFSLLELDIEYRMKAGLPALLAEGYFEHPRLQRGDGRLDDVQQMKLIQGEYEKRFEQGQRPSREYEAAFPQHSEALRQMKPFLRCPNCGRILVLEETLETLRCPDCGCETSPFADILKEDAGKPERLPYLLGIIEKICQAVAYAHSKRVIHRDLKPANVMVGRFGEVQVMDWGLAKVLKPEDANADSEEKTDAAGTRIPTEADTPADLSRPGSGFGTPAYMPPEQALGERDAVDERVDVFALGSILCEMLTGQPAYIGTDGNEVYRQAKRGDVAEIQERLQQCGAEAELTALCRESLSPTREDRPRDAAVMAKRVAKQPEDWTTFNTRSLLGESLLDQKKYTEAEPLLPREYEEMKQREAKIPTPSKNRLLKALERLIQLYEATNKKTRRPNGASNWRIATPHRRNPNREIAQNHGKRTRYSR